MKKAFEWVGGVVTLGGMMFAAIFAIMFAQGSYNRGKRSVTRAEEKEIKQRTSRLDRATNDIDKLSDEEIRRRSGQKGWFRD